MEDKSSIRPGVEFAGDRSYGLEIAVPEPVLIPHDSGGAGAGGGRLHVPRRRSGLRAVRKEHTPESRDDVGIGGGRRSLKILELKLDVDRRTAGFQLRRVERHPDDVE